MEVPLRYQVQSPTQGTCPSGFDLNVYGINCRGLFCNVTTKRIRKTLVFCNGIVALTYCMCTDYQVPGCRRHYPVIITSSSIQYLLPGITTALVYVGDQDKRA